jgi:molybdenum cofactor guanylyltransferase
MSVLCPVGLPTSELLHSELRPPLNSSPYPFSGALLAGGRSRRMGQDKRLLPVTWNGVKMPLWQRQLNVLRCLGPGELLISGPADIAYPEDVVVVPDQIPDCGPLGGIFTCLEMAHSSFLLVLAVDLPVIDPAFLLMLIRNTHLGCGAVPIVDRQPEPIVAIYPKAAAEVTRKFLEQGIRSVRRFALELQCLGLVQSCPIAAEEQWRFRNWNTPEDVAAE